MNSEIFHLLYVSEAPETLNYSDLVNILNVAREFNSKHGITGLLIYRDGFFVQLLEGTQAAVQQLVKNIKADPRNHSFRVLVEVTSQDRIFPDWSMAFIDGDISVNETKDLIDFYELAVTFNPNQKEFILPMVSRLKKMVENERK